MVYLCYRLLCPFFSIGLLAMSLLVQVLTLLCVYLWFRHKKGKNTF